jgi:putative Mg2+ transporter-C (MgtC) family protein
MLLLPGDIVKILLAILIGGLIGFEREFRDKDAGFRTIILICVGATLFTIFSIRIAGDKDPGRIAAQIVTGVGFLGAGVLLKDGGGRLKGLTTASIIWLTAALGMGLGSGDILLACLVALLALVVLWLFPFLERRIDSIRDERVYEITIPLQLDKFEKLDALFKNCHLRVLSRKQTKCTSEMTCRWEVSGSPENHVRVAEFLLKDPDINTFRV